MEDLARKLCEAVENEDAKEVENLLKYGANPNLVLPTGIAAIHLASGKESECALRCLTMILQHGGNPNVRSTDDLTPVHVAASWGCCKALVFLLRQGGDPSIQDQDGNTALDLALLENNRRCVVALQEYRERLLDRFPNETQGCNKSYSCSPGDITELSSITLLLESTYENSPLSSTKMSPTMSLPKSAIPGKHMDDALISSQVQMQVLCTKEDIGKEEEIGYGTKCTRDKCDSMSTEAKVEVSLERTSQSSHCSEYFSTHGESEITCDNTSVIKNICSQHVSHRDGENITVNTISEAKTQNNASRRCNPSRTNFDVEALDVSSPEYSDGHMDNTLIKCGNVSKNVHLEEEETHFRSTYSDSNTSLWNSAERRGVSDKIDGSLQNPDEIDVCYMSKDEVKVLPERDVNTPSSIKKEEMQAAGNEELMGACTFTAKNTQQTVRDSEMQSAAQTLTLPVEGNNSEHGSQDLQILLRDLLLSTKGCYRSGLQAAHGTVKDEIVKNESSSSSSENTLIVDSREHHGKGDSELQQDLSKIILATKNFHLSSTSEDKSPFFTPRSKSRLDSFKFRQNISSLFEDSVEMPKRGRRLRSPDGPLASPTPYISQDDLLPKRNSYSSAACHIKSLNTSDIPSYTVTKTSPELTLTTEILKHNVESLSVQDATFSIGNFLTDDLSSETEIKSSLPLKKISSNHGGILESAWLTEDGESDISDVADHKNINIRSTLEKPLSVPYPNGSFLHSTLINDMNSCKFPRYSFSRLSCIPKAETSSIHDFTSQEVPLSPGGRPVPVSKMEPVEYLYKDNEEGHVFIEKHMPSINQSDNTGNSDNTIIYNWRNYKINTVTTSKPSSIHSPNRVAVELYRLTNDEIASRLKGLGEAGHVTSQNRKMCILLLDKLLKEQTLSRPTGLSFDYSPELSFALNTFNIPDCSKDEAALSQEFDQPDKKLKWREGVLKSSFNYLLLDPRVTRNLPSRCHDISQLDCFRTFVSAIFYVGKGKRSRPYCHLYEALAHYKGSSKQTCSKVQHIIDVWKSGQGVLSLHCFQNTIPVEAYTREACMVDAFGLKMLTNQKKGIYYGQAQNWTPARRRRLGVHMLYKAMQIFLAEGERQLRPPDIRSGQ